MLAGAPAWQYPLHSCLGPSSCQAQAHVPPAHGSPMKQQQKQQLLHRQRSLAASAKSLECSSSATSAPPDSRTLQRMSSSSKSSTSSKAQRVSQLSVADTCHGVSDAALGLSASASLLVDSGAIHQPGNILCRQGSMSVHDSAASVCSDHVHADVAHTLHADVSYAGRSLGCQPASMLQNVADVYAWGEAVVGGLFLFLCDPAAGGAM